jgi:pimeloyl-ACP methyl ester carboxylesterase
MDMKFNKFSYPGENLTLTPKTRKDATGKFIELENGFVHYQLEGPDDGEVVVLVHGFSVPFYIWDPTFEMLLEKGYRVLRYDLFGRGYSDRPNKKNDKSLFDDQLSQLLEKIAITLPINLFGLSMGGAVAGYYTAQHSEKVKRLILVDPVGVKSPLSTLAKVVHLPLVGEIGMMLLSDKTVEKSIAADFFKAEYVAEFVERYRVQMKYKGFRRSLLSSLRSGMLSGIKESYEKIGTLDLPVLLVWGEKDITVPIIFSKKIRSLIPQIEYHPIADSGHLPHYEKREEVNEIFLNFLGK